MLQTVGVKVSHASAIAGSVWVSLKAVRTAT